LESPFLGIAALDHLGWLGSGKKPEYFVFGFFIYADGFLSTQGRSILNFFSKCKGSLRLHLQ
jgi:hypothetical protein